MTDIRKVRLGRLTIGFSGENFISDQVLDEFGSALPISEDIPGVIFHFTLEKTDSSFRIVSNVLVGHDRIRIILHRQLVFDIFFEDEPTRIQIYSSPDWYSRFSTAEAARKIKDWNYLTKSEQLAKDFAYNVFDWVTQIYQLKLGQTYIHASAMTKGDRTVAFLASGGVGKTSAVLKFCTEYVWRYISDDLAVIDDAGVIFRSPKRLQIYGYNIIGEKEIGARLLRGHSILDRTAWELRRVLLGPKRVRRRVSAEHLFGSAGVAGSGKLTDLIFLERRSEAGCAITDISGSEIAKRMASIVMEEIEPYSTIHRRIMAAGSNQLPAPSSVEALTLEVLQHAFRNVPAKLVAVGPNVTPTSLVDAMRVDLL